MSYESGGRRQKAEDRRQTFIFCPLSSVPCRLTSVFCLLYLFQPSAFGFAYPIDSHEISIKVDTRNHSLSAVDKLTIKDYKGERVKLLFNENTKIAEIRLDGIAAEFKGELKEHSFYKRVYEADINLRDSASEKGSLAFEIKYSITFDKKPESPKFSREFISDEAVGYMGEEGTFLSPAALWYPALEGDENLPSPQSSPQRGGEVKESPLPAGERERVRVEFFSYKITIDSEKGYEFIAAGDRVKREEIGKRVVSSFEFLNPAEEIVLVGGRYKISEDKYKDIKIYTYFFPEDENLSAGYIESVKNYLKLYDGLIGRYPFGQFSVVSNFLPTGYGFPTFTLLGQEVLRLPFIKDTSLGHEILHNWFGNSIYVDYESGNWCEGLTTYLADHYYKELKGEGVNYRKEMLRGYASYINEGNDFPLKDFKSRTETFTRAVGYNKSAFVFHMLRVEMGEEKFFTAIKEVIKRQSFKITSWKDIQRIFEDVKGESLDRFFKQWIEDKGAPFLRVKDQGVRGKDTDGAYITSFKIIQEGRPTTPFSPPSEGGERGGFPYILNVPIEIKTEKETIKKPVGVKDKEESIEIKTSSRPLVLSIDPDADIFRLLHKEEIPATISRVMGGKNRIIVLPTGGNKEIINAYGEIAGVFSEGKSPPIMKKDSDLTVEDIKNNSLYIFGGLKENKILEKLIDRLPDSSSITTDEITINNRAYRDKGDFTVLTIPNKFNSDKAVMIIIGFSPDGIRAAGGKLVHYGKYSFLAFKDGKNVDKGIWETKESPLIVKFDE